MAIISEPHRNSLHSSLRLVERDLRRIKNELEQDNSKNERSVLYVREDDVDIYAKPKMLEIVKTMLEEVKEMKDKFGLGVDKEQISGEISSYLSEIWVLLEDMRARGLKAYGHVSEGEKTLIEPRVMKMLKELEEIEKIFHNSKKR